ncbi:MAG: hypothetical protein MUD11_16450 [Rhodobacteraceae bacterium]|jgi:hypothetical protein|nr:hypothetical protein [Paracoccaceae bacterium]
MALLDDLAEKLSQDVIDAMDALGDDRLHEQVSKVLMAASPTVQEAFMTCMRFRLAERRGRKFLEQTIKAAKEGGEAPVAPRAVDTGH